MQIFLMMNDSAPPHPKWQWKAHTWHGCVVHESELPSKVFLGSAGVSREEKGVETTRCCPVC